MALSKEKKTINQSANKNTMITRPPKPIKVNTALQFKQLQKAISTKEKITYKLQGKYTFQGLPIDVENKAGSIRRSEPGQTPKWETKMGYDYGYIRNTEAKDKEAVDVYVNLKSKGVKEDYHTGEVVDTDVYVVHQKQIWKSKNWHNGICPTCKKHHTECNHAYDEDKVMLGFESKEAAIKAYLEQYDSRMFLGPVSTYILAEFKTALKNSWGKKLPHKKTKYEHWTGFDLDGTTAKDEGYKGPGHIGSPIKRMVDRIHSLLKQGKKVRIMTARASDKKEIPHIKEWMKNNNIPLLEITNKKDPGMINLFDDRVTRVNKNSGNLAKSYYVNLVKDIMAENPDGLVSAKEMSDFIKSCGKDHYSVKKSYLGAQGDPAGSFPMMKENIGQRSYSVDKTPRTISEALDDIEKSFESNKMDGEDMDDYTRRYMRELHGKNVSSMLDVDNGYGDMDKAFVKGTMVKTKSGKSVYRKAHFDKRKKKEEKAIIKNRVNLNDYDLDSPFTHSGGKIDKIKRTGEFDGIFAVQGEYSESGVDLRSNQTTFYLRKDKIAGDGDDNLDYDKSIAFLKYNYPDSDDDQIDLLYELIAEDKNVFNLDENPLEAYGIKNLGEAGWEAQRMRGQMAADQGYDGIWMDDEAETSVLIPYQSKAIKKEDVEAIKKDQNLKKAFVKASTYVNKQGKMVHRQAYVDKRKKKITHVKHSKMTRMDLTSKDAQKKIDEAEKKKKHHNLHIEAAEKEKKSVAYNKEIGNSQYAIGGKLHDIDSVMKHLDDHIDHHTNEVKSHDNHIKKIKERHETEAKHWEKKREESKTKEKTKADHINDLLKDGEHKGKKLDKDTVSALKKMKGEEKNKVTFSTQKEYSEWYRKQPKDIKEEHKLNRVGGKFVATWGDYGAIEPVIVRKAGKKETEYTIPKKAVVAKKERTEAEKTKSKSDDMKGNKNAFKGGPKDEPEKKAREPKNISVSKGKAASPVEPSSKEPEKIVVSDERRIDYSGKKVEGVPPHLEKEPEIKVEKPKKDYYPKVTEKDGNIHFDFSEEPKGEISIPEFKSTGFTKLTKKDIETGAKGTPLESAVTLAKSFGEKLAETEKSKHEKREESMRKFAKERDREHIGHHFISPKVDIGYQIVDGDVYLRVNIGRPKRTYYKDSPLPDKIPTKKTAIIIDPSGKSIEAGRSWRDEIEVQKKVYTANSKLSSEDYSIIETLQKSSYHTRHRFFQNAEYDLETNTIKAEASTKRLAGDPDTKISANLTVPRYLHLLAHYNSKQSGRFMGSGYVVPEKNLPVSVKDQIAIFREDNKAYGERISSTYYESYLKGLETSFGEKNSKDTLKADYGVKIKRQNGKDMTDDEVESLKVVIDHTYNSMGNPRVLRKFAEENNLKISFSGDKRAFLTKAVGLYVPNESTVVVGDTMREVLPHEMTHFVDDVLGGKMGAEGKGRGYYASEMQNTDIGRMTAEGRQTFSKDKRTNGAYWSRSCEVFARMVEQYSAINDGNKGYYTMPGYWNEGAFKKLEPKIVAVLKANLGKSFGEFFPQKPYSVKKAV